MEKRFFLALLLTGVVLVATPLLFRPTPVPTGRTAAPVQTRPESAPATVAPPARQDIVQPQASRGTRPTPSTALPAVIPETIRVATTEATIAYSSVGATPLAVTVQRHQALRESSGPVVIQDGADPLLRFRTIQGTDTTDLTKTAFRVTRIQGGNANGVSFTSADPSTLTEVEYRTTATPYLTQVRVTAPLARERAYLLVNLPSGFTSHEADTVDDIRHLAFAGKPVTSGARGIGFGSLDPMERELVPGPLSWAAAKSKYFIVGLLSPNDSMPFAELQAVGGPRSSKLATRAAGTVVIPFVNGQAAFSLFAGPQSWENMRALGREFETANPYGGFMQPVVQPFSTIVMRLMLWLKRVVRLDYGWVLVIFGLAIRIVLWPLNQSAMRASLRLQRIQPELMAVQERYKQDRAKQQQEVLRVYQAHGMSPFSALSGCLPALIPMPVFFALFFVFQNTIEFRGVPFLWLADISLRDPLYILPIVTGASMFVLSWIGMRNMPKNPQTTMMLYLMPGMFTVFLLSTASGLSIYYLVQQIAAIPQQWMIANERRKAQPAR